MHTIKIAALALVFATSLSAHMSIPFALPAIVKKVSAATPNSNSLALVGLDRIRISFPRGHQVGVYEERKIFVNNCGGLTGPIEWDNGPGFYRDQGLIDVFNSQLRRANFNIAGDSSELFEKQNPNRPRPRYLIGGEINHLTMKICDEVDTWDKQRTGLQSGHGKMRVSWQVFDTLTKKVVYRTQSRGSAKLRTGLRNGQAKLITQSFAAAAGNLATDRKLVSLLKKKQTVPTIRIQKVRKPPRWIPPVANWSVGITNNIDQIRGSIVTIENGTGHGSGFFVSPSLVLTNHHVVKGAQFVQVRLLTGQKVLGEVLRKHLERDVALIQVRLNNYQPLPIRKRPLKITEDVFAIGTPLQTSLSGTVTKGIVSKFASNRYGLIDVQADVFIQHGSSGGPLLDSNGNVVGVAYAGLGSASVGINFFVPIADALDKLNVVKQGN